MPSHRIPRPIIPGATYFLTSVAYRRKPLFSIPCLAKIVVDQWLYYEKHYNFDLAAYAIMPDHYHLVLSICGQKTVSQILNAVNSYTSTLINQALGNINKQQIWERAPWDEVIRSEEMYWQKIAYTLMNPWRNGLVKEPLHSYPYSNLSTWLDREGEDFVLDLFSRFRRADE